MRDYASGLDPYTATLLALQRRRALAQAQIEQGMETTPIRHWSQGANRALQLILGTRDANRVDAEMQAAAREREAGREAEMARVRELLTGTETVHQPSGWASGDAIDAGGEAPAPTVIRQGPDRAALAREMLGMRNPEFQRLGMQFALAKPPEEEAFTLKPGEARFRGSRQVASLPPEPQKPERAAPDPEAVRLSRIANDPARPEFERRTAQALLDKMTRQEQSGGTPYFSPLATPEGVYRFDHRTGGLTPAVGPDGAPVVRSSDSPDLQGRIAGAKTFGKGGAEDLRELATTATKAAEGLPKIDATLALLKSGQPITGIGAETLTNIERLRSQFLASEKAGKRVSDSQLLNAMLGSDVFPMIGALGIGARGLDTPAEREFLRQVMTGTNTMDRDSLIRLTEIRRDIQMRAIERWNERVRAGEADDYFRYTGRKKGELQAPGAGGGGGGGGLPRVTTKAERDALPPGTRYIAPDGSERVR